MTLLEANQAAKQTTRCRCVFCGESSRDHKIGSRLFIAGKKKYGRDKTVWGLCGECLVKCVEIATLEATR